MTYPRRHLQEDENILSEQGLHIARVLPNLLRALLILALLGAGFFLWKNSPAWFGLLLGVVFVATLAWVFVNLLAFRSTRLVLTNQRLIFRSGIVRRTVKNLPLATIKQVAVEHSFIERVFHLGHVRVVDETGSEETFRDLVNASDLATSIEAALAQAERDRVRRLVEAGTAGDRQRELGRIKSLHERGVLTDDELGHFVDELGGGSA